jgi:hypothetical protein
MYLDHKEKIQLDVYPVNSIQSRQKRSQEYYSASNHHMIRRSLVNDEEGIHFKNDYILPSKDYAKKLELKIRNAR